MTRLIKAVSTLRQSFRRDERGAISVEMALIASAMFFAALPLADMTVRLFSSMQLTSSVRAGMQYAMEHPDDIAGIENAMMGNTGSLDSEVMEVSVDQFCECAGTVYGCDEVCGYGMQTFLSLNASYNQGLLMDYPGFGQSLPMTKSMTLRIE